MEPIFGRPQFSPSHWPNEQTVCTCVDGFAFGMQSPSLFLTHMCTHVGAAISPPMPMCRELGLSPSIRGRAEEVKGLDRHEIAHCMTPALVTHFGLGIRICEIEIFGSQGRLACSLECTYYTMYAS